MYTSARSRYEYLDQVLTPSVCSDPFTSPKMDRMDPSDPVMLLWQANEAVRVDDTDATVSDNSQARSLDVRSTDAPFYGLHEPLLQKVPPLPLEIIDMILREACKFPLSRAEHKVLIACTLVCKSWLPLARRLLYESVIVQTGSAYATTRSPGTIGSKELLQQSHVLEFTRSLSISVLGESTAMDLTLKGRLKRVRIPDFFALLDHTPRLRCLQLSLVSVQKNIAPYRAHIKYWLSRLELCIEVLDIEVNDAEPFRSTFAYNLVGLWPTIKALRVVTGDSRPPPGKPNTNLRQLTLLSTCSAANIEWLLPRPPPNEQSNLRFLGLKKIPEKARAILSVHGPGVSTLTLWCQPDFEIAQVFTNLEELVIKGPWWTAPPSTFPRTLKHIRLEVFACLPGDFSFFSNSIVAAIAEELTILPNLRVISIGKTLTSNKYYPDLQEACETHGVEILVSPNRFDSAGRTVSAHQKFRLVCHSTDHHHKHKHPYHVEMDRFPRQYTFSEFFDIGERRLCTT